MVLSEFIKDGMKTFYCLVSDAGIHNTSIVKRRERVQLRGKESSLEGKSQA